MLYPSLLEPNDWEVIKLEDRERSIPKKRLILKEWDGPELEYSFGNKPLIDFNGIPLFAELSILT